MKKKRSAIPLWTYKPSLHPQWAIFLRRVDAVAQLIGATAILVGHGLRRTGVIPWEFGAVTLVTMLVISIAMIVRFRWSLAQRSFARRHLWTVSAAGVWISGMVLVTILGPVLPDTNGPDAGGPRWWGYVHLSEVVLGLYAIAGAIRGLRRFTAGGANPAVLLVSSFLLLMTVGTIGLMLPASRQVPEDEPLTGAPFHVALFTATSASCVTGLIVVDTPTYWSPVGQAILLLLFQIGGLGIMTFSAFFAVIAGKNVRLSEFANVRDLLSSEGIGDVRKVIYSILGFTFGAEILGTILLLPMFSELPFPQRLFMSAFHSVSAFCNAGFALTENSFVGMAETWSVGGVVTALIIIGGLGFGVLFNVLEYLRLHVIRLWHHERFHLPRARRRLRMETRMVLLTTLFLLSGGWLSIYLLERTSPDQSQLISVSDAWFQSVTFRTAGFNTVDLGELQPATKLAGIFLMFVGASPGSTGGGMKTIVLATAVVGLVSILRGRDKVEAFGRTIANETVNRALAVAFVFILTVMVTTILLVIFENRPDRFLDHLFEATSAVGTVGVSSTVTADDGQSMSVTFSLSRPSQFVIVVAMFLGRVGPLTLLLALSGGSQQTKYDYPTERVTLG